MPRTRAGRARAGQRRAARAARRSTWRRDDPADTECGERILLTETERRHVRWPAAMHGSDRTAVAQLDVILAATELQMNAATLDRLDKTGRLAS